MNHPVSFTYISQPIFQNLSWEIHSNRCVGLVGANGSGKSTLLRLVAGELTSDSGYLVQSKDLRIGYLPQEPVLQAGNTVWQETLSASTDLRRINQALTEIETQLADPAVYGDEEKLTQVIDQQSRLWEEFDQYGGPGYEGRVRSTLHSLGFDNDTALNLPVEVLSGGQKKLIGLAKLLVTRPDVLLLDELDNHLDLAGKGFLEKLINEYQGAVIIVSHDRYLLDLVVDEIVEIEDGRLTHYHGEYSEYAFEKQSNLLRQQQLFQAQQKEIDRLEQAANRLLTWGRVYDNHKLIKRGRNILKRLERLDRIDKPILERKRMGLELEGWRGSSKVVEIRELDKVFSDEQEDHIVLAGLNLLIWHGERVGLVGPNGSGKSLLFRLILEEYVPTDGEIVLGPSVEVGYYAQEHETLDYSRTLIDTVRHAARLSESEAVSFLGKFLFTYEQARSPVSVDPNLAILAIFSRDCRDFGVIYSDFGYRKQPISYLKIAQI
ncbi:ATP-binding cassette domain-containing protein [Chloroflexi bacterium TSY]|nr:ATP-binding cassette domain-containing protein [Chloroflexi bacterium TSY]